MNAAIGGRQCKITTSAQRALFKMKCNFKPHFTLTPNALKLCIYRFEK